MIIWYFPLFKQSATKYYFYFLVSAISAPAGLLALFFLKVLPQYTCITVYLLLLAAFLEKKKAYYAIALAVIAAVLFPLIKPSTRLIFSVAAILDLIIFLNIILQLMDRFLKKSELNFFLMLLFIYHAIDLVKMFDIAVNLNLGIAYYYIGLVAQLLFGIAFWFINVNTKNFKIKLKALEEM